MTTPLMNKKSPRKSRAATSKNPIRRAATPKTSARSFLNPSWNQAQSELLSALNTWEKGAITAAKSRRAAKSARAGAERGQLKTPELTELRKLLLKLQKRMSDFEDTP